jgi:peroxiredoxin
MLPGAESLEGKRVPDVTFKTRSNDRWVDVNTDDVLSNWRMAR